MTTILKYSVQKETEYDPKSGKMKDRIVSRGFEFMVKGAKSESEHVAVIDSFQEFMMANGVQCDGFGCGAWEDYAGYSTEDYLYLAIGIDYPDEKEEIRELYNEWKKST